MTSHDFEHRFIDAVAKVPKSDWQQLAGTALFTSYEWLDALEQSRSVGGHSGWQPHHLVIYQTGKARPIAILPGYLKSHSYGEYVFDWAWAEAYERHNITYYPKWLSAVPFTPVVGSRLLCQTPTDTLHQYILTVLNDAASQHSWSGFHINFPHNNEDWPAEQLMKRHGVQFHWHNRNYADFDAFLVSLKARKRKMIKKERAQVNHSNLQIRWLHKAQITPEVIAQFYLCYCQTYRKRSGHNGYLTQQFFTLLFANLPDNTALCCAYRANHQHDPSAFIAASLYLIDENTLYGRYWGALEESEHLHFELCYYQGIEYAIFQGLQRFDAGAQGEHKLLRGFEPVYTHSYHTLVHPLFKQAVAEFIHTERAQLAQYYQQCQALLPFKEQ
ncbi:GNAT family N-acetyltransferase [Pseudoalteromonas sp. SMS1]|uniref:GNAT family N-acetyltransferase n=1 Tax=Pseudoalteromonas sp. SMS1 TaxID=2908894 RepID=UPI001F275EFC|nr:GNAT family N-acetyltransferase [Pseudoalteromonas sp. SMS1]MCF2858528.1 GNAT family N-acetyltransferase [Pseudoalteromonas sp. SMS1]